MVFSEISFESWAADQTAEIGAALAANPGRPLTWAMDAGLVMFHGAWPLTLCERLRVEGLTAVVLDPGAARGKVEIRVTPPWPANGAVKGPRSFASRPRAGRPRTSRSAIPGYQPRRRGAGGLAR